MYIIKISDLSYKVILSKSDFGDYGNDVFEGGECSKAFFSDVLGKVNSQHSCTKTTSVVHADFFEDKFGGGELFLYFSDSHRNTTQYILICDNFENILTSCRIINCSNFRFLSQLFFKEHKYYLVLETLQKENEPPASLYEMGKLIKTDKVFIWHLEEHGIPIIHEDAVEKAVFIFNKQ